MKKIITTICLLFVFSVSYSWETCLFLYNKAIREADNTIRSTMNGCLISTVENWTTMDVYSAFMNSNCAMNAYYEWVRGYDVAAEWLGACIQEEPVPTPTDSIAVPVEPSPNP